MAGYGRLPMMFPTGASGAAPGNSFPDLSYDDTGDFNRRQREKLDDFDRQTRLMRLASQLQRGGNNNMMPNGMTEKPMDVVFKDSPNPNLLSRGEKEEIRLRDRALDLTSRGQDVQRDIATDRNAYMLEKLGSELAIKQQRADAYDRRVDQPNLKVFRGADGKEYTWDENTGKIVSELGAGARMTDEQLAQRRQSDMLERIAKQLEGNIQRDDNRAQNERTLIGDRTQGQININANKPQDPMSPRDQMAEVDLRFRTALNDPKYAPFIQTGPDGRTLSLVPATGLSPEQQRLYQEVRKYIFPPTTPASGGNTAPVTAPITTAPPTPEGKVLVISPTGQKGYIPQARLGAYTAGGYKVAEGGK